VPDGVARAELTGAASPATLLWRRVPRAHGTDVGRREPTGLGC
jgi:hypothetical protein